MMWRRALESGKYKGLTVRKKIKHIRFFFSGGGKNQLKHFHVLQKQNQLCFVKPAAPQGLKHLNVKLVDLI